MSGNRPIALQPKLRACSKHIVSSGQITNEELKGLFRCATDDEAVPLEESIPFMHGQEESNMVSEDFDSMSHGNLPIVLKCYFIWPTEYS